MRIAEFVMRALSRVLGKYAPSEVRISFSIPLGGPSGGSAEAEDKHERNKNNKNEARSAKTGGNGA